MSAIHMQKLPNGTLAPNDNEAQDYLRKLKTGQDVQVKVTRQRNYLFHRKWFALLQYAFDLWQPVESQTRHGIVPEKSFDRFRKDVTILAGFYTATYRLNGGVRIEARSISFASMSADEFEDLYSKSINVILRLVLKDVTEDELRRDVEDMVLSFA